VRVGAAWAWEGRRHDEDAASIVAEEGAAAAAPPSHSPMTRGKSVHLTLELRVCAGRRGRRGATGSATEKDGGITFRSPPQSVRVPPCARVTGSASFTSRAPCQFTRLQTDFSLYVLKCRLKASKGWYFLCRCAAGRAGLPPPPPPLLPHATQYSLVQFLRLPSFPALRPSDLISTTLFPLPSSLSPPR
jgi:hypothetical protein